MTPRDVATAERIWRGSKPKILVSHRDGRTEELGGNRAARAAAVIILASKTHRQSHALGLRSDLAAAQAEAHRLDTETEYHGRASLVEWAVAIPVADDDNPKGSDTDMAKADTIHVSGATPDEINASFRAAYEHYTPEGKKRPNGGVIQRLRKESDAAFAALDATRPPEAPQSPREPRSAAGAAATAIRAKVTATKATSDRNGDAAAKAAERVDRAVSEAKADTDDPYRTAMRNRRDSGDKRGPGAKVTDDELDAYVRQITTDHPDYLTGQVWECCRWAAKLAVSPDRFNESYRRVTGREPVRRARNRAA